MTGALWPHFREPWTPGGHGPAEIRRRLPEGQVPCSPALVGGGGRGQEPWDVHTQDVYTHVVYSQDVYTGSCPPGTCAPGTCVPGSCTPRTCTPGMCSRGWCTPGTCVPGVCTARTCAPGLCTPGTRIPGGCSLWAWRMCSIAQLDSTIPSFPRISEKLEYHRDVKA